MTFSVIIPTCNRCEALARTLDSVTELDFPPRDFEVIVVDNGSRDRTREAFEAARAAASRHNWRYINEPMPGLLSGRHKGALEGQADVCVFIDDDVRLGRDWLNALDDAFREPFVALVGGPSSPIFEGDSPDWLAEFYYENKHGRYCGYLSLIDGGERAKEIHPCYVWGLNSAIRRKILFDLGGFHPDSMPKPLQRFQGDGEMGLSLKLATAGLQAFYHPKASVRHEVPKSRLNVEYFEQRAFSTLFLFYSLNPMVGVIDGFRYLLSENGHRPPNNHSPLTDNQSSNGASPASASASQALRTSTSDVRSSSEDFWALRDVSFELKRGEVLGIIGRNGAGKSTLLKILSRITEPTTGTVEIEGRVASLLEVGTGFHPELTGRENIFLNGAILGMTRTEIRKKFEKIVAFAELEQFLDTPVKRYSSGMYVRLAFAVAAHLEPELLIVDEVLAVGDEEFQKRCLGKMQEVCKEGRTVLFVSHNMASIEKLCTKALLLTRGNVSHSGKVTSVVEAYIGEPKYESEVIFEPHHDKQHHKIIVEPRKSRARRLDSRYFIYFAICVKSPYSWVRR